MKSIGGKKKSYIGVFDSGFGGISVLRGIVKALPQYDYLYVGDTVRAPYGTRSKEVVYEFTRQAVDFMFANGCKLIVLACNTASSDALRKIQQEYLPKHYPDRRVLGVLIPAAEEAVGRTKNGKVGVIATEGTVRSEAFVRELTKINPRVKVIQQACPLLVPIVEAGEHHSKVARLMLETYLKPIRRSGVDTLILGCTHYGILEHQIKRIVGPCVRVVSESVIVPDKLKDYLGRHSEIERTLSKRGARVFYSTDLTDAFSKLGSKFFGKPIKAEKIMLG